MEGLTQKQRKETLSLLYTSLSKLDKDFKRTSKSRTAFINERFGGSFADGSVILLDYVSGDYEDPEDIKKLSFVRDITSKLADSYSELESLHSFSFERKPESEAMLEMLTAGEFGVYGPVAVAQDELNSPVAATHYVVSPKGSRFVPKGLCRKVMLFSNPMVQWASIVIGREHELQLGDALEVRNGRLCVVRKK